jgi:hypothetical protein
MNIRRWIATATVLAASAVLMAQTLAAQTAETPRPPGLSRSKDKALQARIDGQNSNDLKRITADAELLEKSRAAGLLTEWHLEGRYEHWGRSEFARQYTPEKEAAKQGARRRFERSRYELLFPDGTFALPKELAGLKGVFYANSNTYLTSSGEWNVYVESGAEAVVFVDGRRAVTRGPKATGVLRGKIHLESGYHSVMVKFLAQAAPFRVAILPLNSGSKRKNNTPYLQASPAQEDMMAEGGTGRAPKAQPGD